VKYKLGIVGVQQVRWSKAAMELVDDFPFFCGCRNANHHLGTDIFLHKGIRSTVTRVVFVNDRMVDCVVLLF